MNKSFYYYYYYYYYRNGFNLCLKMMLPDHNKAQNSNSNELDLMPVENRSHVNEFC